MLTDSERKPGRSKLVYDKTKQAIVVVSEGKPMTDSERKRIEAIRDKEDYAPAFRYTTGVPGEGLTEADIPFLLGVIDRLEAELKARET